MREKKNIERENENKSSWWNLCKKLKGLRALFSAVGHIQVRNLSVWIIKIEIWLNCLKSLLSSKKLFISWPFFEFCFLVYEKNILQMMKETFLNTTIAIYSLIGTDWHLQKKKLYSLTFDENLNHDFRRRKWFQPCAWSSAIRPVIDIEWPPIGTTKAVH